MNLLLGYGSLAFTSWWIAGTIVFLLMRKHRKTVLWRVVYGPLVFILADFIPALAQAMGMRIWYAEGNVNIAFCRHDPSEFKAICRDCGQEVHKS